MTPERAQEILNAKSDVMPGFRLISVGDINTILAPGERGEVNAVWDTMDGNTSFYDALCRIAQGRAG